MTNTASKTNTDSDATGRYEPPIEVYPYSVISINSFRCPDKIAFCSHNKKSCKFQVQQQPFADITKPIA